MEQSGTSVSCDNLSNCDAADHAVNVKFVRNLGKHSKKDVIRWCMKMNLITSEYMCPKCGSLMKLIERDVTDGYEWKCRGLRPDGHSVIRGVRKGSWFNHSRLSLEVILQLTNMWAKRIPREVIRKEMGISERTLTEWKQLCREVCLKFLKKEPVKLGGPGTMVELREIKLARRNSCKQTLPGKHVLVGIQCGTKNCFISEIKFDSVETLRCITETYILPGTTVASPCWGVYSRYEPQEFINMQRHCGFIMKFQRKAEAGQTEIWSAIREVLNGARQGDDCFEAYLAECMIRVRYYGNPDDLYLSFLKAVTQVQPPLNKDEEESEQEEVLGAADESCEEEEVKCPLARKTYSKAISRVTVKTEREVCFDPEQLEVVLVTDDPD